MGDRGRAGPLFDPAGIFVADANIALAGQGLGRHASAAYNARHLQRASLGSFAEHDGVVASYTLLATLRGPLHARTRPQHADLHPMVTISSASIGRAPIPTKDGLMARFAR
jgi:hypothetical protein